MDDEQQPPVDLPPLPPTDPLLGTGEEPPPPPRRGKKGIAIAAGIVAALALAGGAGAFLLLRGAGERLLDKVPADTDAVVTIYLDPAASQKVNLLRMADEIPSLGSGEEIRGQIDDAIEQALSEVELTLDDLEWVGSQVAITVNFPGTGSPEDVMVTALIETDDEGAASQTLADLREQDPPSGGWQREDHDGIEVWVGSEGSDQVVYAVLDGVVVFSNSADAIDDVIAASRGRVDSLAASASFQESTAGLPEGKLALLYTNPSELSAAIERLQPTVFDPSVVSSTQTLEGIRGMAMSVSAEEDGLAMDVQVTFDPEALSPATRETLTSSAHANPLLEGVPSDAIAVVSEEGLRATFEGFVDQVQELAPKAASSVDMGFVDAMTGDLAIAAMPTGETGVPSGVVMIGTSDEAAMVDSIDSFVNQAGIPKAKWVTADHGGVGVTTLVDRKAATPYAFSYAVFDGAAVFGASPDAVFAVIDARQSGTSITEAPAYRDAMAVVPVGTSSVYVDIDGLADTIRGQLPPEQVAEFDASVGETMDHLDAFVMGMESSDTSAHVRMVLRVG